MQSLTERFEDTLRVEEVRCAEHRQCSLTDLSHSTVAAVICAADFEYCAFARSIRAIEDNALQESGQERQPHRRQILRERVRHGNGLLLGKERVVLPADERVVDDLGQS